MTQAPGLFDVLQKSMPRREVQDRIQKYEGMHDESTGGDVDARKTGYETMINDFYDLVTDFYEFGWGQSFHFAPRFRGEELAASIARHQHYLALQLGLRPDMKVLDIGCGVGGPMRSIARFSGASVLGINNCAYQIQRGRTHNKNERSEDKCDFLKADFNEIPLTNGAFDAAYTIEATCHSPDRTRVFGEVHRLLKPGSEFAGYEWCLTDRYDATNPDHRAMKKDIESGNGLPDLTSYQVVLDALEKVGFEVLDSADVATTSDPETPWYLPLGGTGFGLRDLRNRPYGRWVTHHAVGLLEKARVAPRGAQAVSTMLNRGADALVAAGEAGIFTPMFFFRARRR